jgi:hypothetical protein
MISLAAAAPAVSAAFLASLVEVVTLYITPVLFLCLESLCKMSRRKSDPGGPGTPSKIG